MFFEGKLKLVNRRFRRWFLHPVVEWILRLDVLEMTVIEHQVEIFPQRSKERSPRLKGLPRGIPLCLVLLKLSLVGLVCLFSFLVGFLRLFQVLLRLCRFLARLSRIVARGRRWRARRAGWLGFRRAGFR